MKLTSIITDYIARTILTVNGDILTRVAGVLTRFGIGTDGQVLRVNVAATAVEWGDPNTIDDVNGLTLQCKKIDIGDWNMVASPSKIINHGLTLNNIISYSAHIRNDNNDFHREFNSGIDNLDTTPQGCFSTMNVSDFVMFRLNNGAFDHTDYDSTSYNRGSVFIWYLA